MLRKELLKFRRPLVYILLGVLVGSISLIFSGYQDSAEVQRLSAIHDYEVFRDTAFTPQDCQEYFGIAPGDECERLFQEELGAARAWVDDSRSVYPMAHIQQDPVGMLGVVAGQFASLLGLVAAAVLVGAHTAGEWTHGTYKPVLARYGRGPWFVVLKIVATWITMMSLLIAVYVCLLLLSPLHRILYSDIHPSPPGFSMWGYAIPSLLRSMLVVFFFVTLAVACAVVTKSSLGAVGLTVALAVVLLVTGALSSMSHVSPGFWVSRVMNFNATGMFAEHLWIDQLAAGAGDVQLPSRLAAGGALSLTAGAAGLLAWWRMATSDAA